MRKVATKTAAMVHAASAPTTITAGVAVRFPDTWARATRSPSMVHHPRSFPKTADPNVVVRRQSWLFVLRVACLDASCHAAHSAILLAAWPRATSPW